MRLLLLVSALYVLIGCASSQAPKEDLIDLSRDIAAQAASLKNEDVAREYGRLLRKKYREEELNSRDARYLNVLQTITRDRGILRSDQIHLIAKGEIFLAMSELQAIATLPALRIVESTTLENKRLVLYKGAVSDPAKYFRMVPIYGGLAGREPKKPMLLVCNGNLIAIGFHGSYTFEARKATYDAQRRFQTNFRPGDFRKGSPLMLLWQRAGFRGIPKVEYQTITRRGVSGIARQIAQRGIAKHVDYSLERGYYPSLLKSLKRAC